jgi:hypothetical protein
MRKAGLGCLKAAGAIVAVALMAIVCFSTEPTVNLKPSEYAPITDLANQVTRFLHAIDEDLASGPDYDADRKNRIVLNANTLIVLGRTIAQHDESNDIKLAAPALIESASALAESYNDYDAAVKAAIGLKGAMEKKAGGQINESIAPSLAALMKQVPIVNNDLRRGVNGKRFDRLLDDNAGHAATLAAIAHVSMSCPDYCSDAEARVKWSRVCADMRKAAMEVRTAVRQKDLPSATSGLANLVKTCDQCHESFRN